VPFDDILFETNMGEYALVLSSYLTSKFETPLFQDKTEKEKMIISERYPILINKAIREGNYPEQIKEFLLAKNTYTSLSLMGINSVTNSIFYSFKKEFPISTYLTLLEKRYKKWGAISKGKSAPNFIGQTPDGKMLSLSDLKGKVVYVDVWATWCGPCVEQFPYAKKVKQQFEGNNQVIFLYVSVDSNVENWKKYLKNDLAFKGIHINLSNEQYEYIIKSYQMWGIPQFMLIDQEGKIVSVKAPRPSSGKVADEIQKLLKPKSV
jgi:thiol-disulfide isomerase/thioredoxin